MRKIYSIIERLPSLYVLLLRIKHEAKHLLSSDWGWHKKVLRPETELVIEGYPRSGNTFAVHAFNYAQGHNNTCIATHSHSHAPVLVAVRRCLPILVVVRKPEETLVSFMAFEVFVRGKDQGTILKDAYLKNAIRRYIRFYRALMPVKDSLVVATFDEVTGDYGAVICSVNRKYGTNFSLFQHTEENVKRVFSLGPDHMVPSTERNRMKERTKHMVNQGKCASFLEEAISIYRQFTEK